MCSVLDIKTENGNQCSIASLINLRKLLCDNLPEQVHNQSRCVIYMAKGLTEHLGKVHYSTTPNISSEIIHCMPTHRCVYVCCIYSTQM